MHHSVDGMFAIRQGQWKLELCPGSGGWSKPETRQRRQAGLPPVQLYDMTHDVGERQNRPGRIREVVARLTKLLEKYVADGRSTPGPPQQNDVAVNIWKAKRPTIDARGNVVTND